MKLKNEKVQNRIRVNYNHLRINLKSNNRINFFSDIFRYKMLPFSINYLMRNT